MNHKIILLCLCLVCTGRSTYAQWVVSDPTNLAQGIVNSTKQVVRLFWRVNYLHFLISEKSHA